MRQQTQDSQPRLNLRSTRTTCGMGLASGRWQPHTRTAKGNLGKCTHAAWLTATSGALAGGPGHETCDMGAEVTGVPPGRGSAPPTRGPGAFLTTWTDGVRTARRPPRPRGSRVRVEWSLQPGMLRSVPGQTLPRAGPSLPRHVQGVRGAPGGGSTPVLGRSPQEKKKTKKGSHCSHRRPKGLSLQDPGRDWLNWGSFPGVTPSGHGHPCCEIPTPGGTASRSGAGSGALIRACGRSQGLRAHSLAHSFIRPNAAVRAGAGLGGSGTPCFPQHRVLAPGEHELW